MLNFHATVIVSFLLLQQRTTSIKLPSTFQRCDIKSSDFEDCFQTSTRNILPQLVREFPEIGLSSMNPMFISKVDIGENPSSSVAVKQHYDNAEIHGIADADVKSIKFDLNAKTIIANSVCSKLIFKGQYKLEGKVLLLPIRGEGDFIHTLSNTKLRLNLDLEEVMRKKRKHYNVKKSSLLIEPERVVFSFENLFDGNQELGTTINKTLNDNWELVFGEVKSAYEQFVAEVIKGIINRMLFKVPIEDLFLQ